MTSVWNGRMYQARCPWTASPSPSLWDGQIWDIDSWGITKGTHNLEAALAFVTFATGSQPLAEQTKYISYGPARRSSFSLIPDATKPHLPTTPDNMANALQTDAQWWAARHEAIDAEFERWLAQGGRGLSGSAR